jgi:Ras-related protein Rab-1A
LQIWDTAGHERFRSLTKSYYSGGHGAAIVFDLTNRESFEHIDFWVNELQTAGEIPCKILIGNKCDLEQRVVETKEAEEIAQRLEIAYLETSAKQATNIARMFEVMTEAMLDIAQLKSDHESNHTVNLEGKPVVKVKEKKGCC